MIVEAKGSDQQQVDTLGFCWSKGNETQKTEVKRYRQVSLFCTNGACIQYIRNLLDGLLVESGVEIVEPTIVVKV